MFSLAFGRTAATGAATTLNCAMNPALNSQQHFYYDSCRPREPSADARWVGVEPHLQEWVKGVHII